MTSTITLDMLKDAALRCAKGVGWKASVARWVHPRNIAGNCLKLKTELDNGTYRPGGYTLFEVTEPKRRQIKSPRFRDRVVQRAMCDNGLYDDLTRDSIYDNTACQKGKGTTFAIDRLRCLMQRYIRKHGIAGYVARLDIHRFFDSIPHDRLKAMVDAKVRNPEYRHLVHQVIDSFPDPGIGLGSQLSQLMAISYLSGADHYAKERLRLRYYIRYSDDIVIIHHDRNELESAVASLDSMIESLGLGLNPKSCIHGLDQGIRFLKFRFVIDGRRIAVMPSVSGCRRICRRLSKLAAMVMSGARPLSKAWECYESWKSHAAKGDAHNITRRVGLWLKGLFHRNSRRLTISAVRPRLPCGFPAGSQRELCWRRSRAQACTA